MRKRVKSSAQMKSRFQYLFLVAMAGSVVGRQHYVGTSYRAMSRSINRWFEETIVIIQIPQRKRTAPDGYYMPVPTPEDYGMTIVQ